MVCQLMQYCLCTQVISRPTYIQYTKQYSNITLRMRIYSTGTKSVLNVLKELYSGMLGHQFWFIYISSHSFCLSLPPTLSLLSLSLSVSLSPSLSLSLSLPLSLFPSHPHSLSLSHTSDDNSFILVTSFLYCLIYFLYYANLFRHIDIFQIYYQI